MADKDKKFTDYQAEDSSLPAKGFFKYVPDANQVSDYIKDKLKNKKDKKDKKESKKKNMKKGGMVKKHRGDGCAVRGKTKGRMV